MSSKGETYMEGAVREAEEELGKADLEMKLVHTLPATSETSNEFVAFFVTRSDYVPRVHEATESLRPFSIKEIDAMMAHGEKFVPIFIELFKWYKGNKP